MCGSLKIVVVVYDPTSEVDYGRCCFPFLIQHRTKEDGEPLRFYGRETIKSALTGAKWKVQAVPVPLPKTGADFIFDAFSAVVAAYEVEMNACCLIPRNHQLVNGVPRAAEGAYELLRHWAASRGCTPYGLSQFSFENVRLISVTPTFLFVSDSPAVATDRLKELRDHAEGILNRVVTPRESKRCKGPQKCFSVGPDSGYTLYVKERQFEVRAYVKPPDVPKAYATFPDEEVEQELVEQALRTVRVEVTVNAKWLKDNGLDDPEQWRGSANRVAYEKVFNLLRETLRLDEGLRVRAPSDDVIAKLPPDHQVVLHAHLAGQNARLHPLVLQGTDTSDDPLAQNKRFSAFKRSVLDIGVDLTIPWAIQSSQLSCHLKDWLRYPGLFVPSVSLQEHVFSPASVPDALDELRAETERVLAARTQQLEDDKSEATEPAEESPQSAEDQSATEQEPDEPGEKEEDWFYDDCANPPQLGDEDLE